MSVVPFNQSQPTSNMKDLLIPVMLRKMLDPQAQSLADAEAKASVKVIESGVQSLRLQNGVAYEGLLKQQAKSRKRHEHHCRHCGLNGFDPTNCKTANHLEAGQNKFLNSI